MKWTIAAIAIALLVLSLPAGAACKRNAQGVYEDVACATEALSAADKELNDVYRRLLAQVDDDAKTKLRTSQRAWIVYRDSNAGFVYAVEGDGSAGRMVLANQNEQATRARIRELKTWISQK
jgi:uncharacterized protein YecT (DUF1311 family)